MKTYTEEFKKTIVELYENGNKNKSELAREYGTSEGNVRAWIKKYGKIKTSTGEVTTNDEILKLQKENQENKNRKWNIKKSTSHILKTTEDKVKFIDELKDMYDIRTLCKTVKLHHSVYYYHKQNKENSYKKANEELDKKIMEEFNKSRKRYGSPKITRILNKQGIKVSQKRVARRMKVLKLRSIIVKKFNHNGNKKVNDENKENLLAQDFKAEHPSEKLVET